MFYSVAISLLFIIKCIYRKINDKYSLIYNIKKKYGRPTLKLYRELEKSQVKLIRADKSLEFLRHCLLYQVKPKFIRFKPYDKKLIKTNTYKGMRRKMTIDLYRRKQVQLSCIKSDTNKKENKLKNQIALYNWIKLSHYLNERIKKE